MEKEKENSLDLNKPVQTRDGHKVRILCTDRIGDKYNVIGLLSDGDEEGINIRVNWKMGFDVSNLKVGVIKDYLLALKLGLYGYVDLETCPNCNTEDATVYYDDGKYHCSDCD